MLMLVFPRFCRSPLAFLAVTWLAVASVAAGESPGSMSPPINARANTTAQAKEKVKEKVKETRGNARTQAIAEAIAAESGRAPEQFLRYSARLEATLARFSPAELEKIIEGE